MEKTRHVAQNRRTDAARVRFRTSNARPHSSVRAFVRGRRARRVGDDDDAADDDDDDDDDDDEDADDDGETRGRARDAIRAARWFECASTGRARDARVDGGRGRRAREDDAGDD